MWECGLSLTCIFLYIDKIADSVFYLKIRLSDHTYKEIFKSWDKRKDNYWVENPSNLICFSWVILYITVEFKESNKTLFISCTIDLHVYLFGSAASTVFSSKSVRSSLQTANSHTKMKAKMKRIFISVSS